MTRMDAPSPAAAAAAHQEQSAAAETVLALLLQNDSIRTQVPVVCRLLCCSKSLAATVAQHCTGRLFSPQPPPAGSLEARIEQHTLWTGWLIKHAALLKSLECSDGFCVDVHSFVAGLMAAGGPNILQLESLDMSGGYSAIDTALPLLEQLPSKFLTHLKVSDGTLQPPPSEEPAYVTRLPSAITRLTSLRSLHLHVFCDPFRMFSNPTAEELTFSLLGLSKLNQLTKLTFQGPRVDLLDIPVQLRELDIAAWSRQPINLLHLSAVTALTCRAGLMEGAVLPPNLVALKSSVCGGGEALLPLQQLQQLQLGLRDMGMPPQEKHASLTADQLKQLSRLTFLGLDCNEGFGSLTTHECVEALPLLPLQQFALMNVSLSDLLSQQLSNLSRLTSLTSLRLQQREAPRPDTAQRLAVALRHVSVCLRQLELSAQHSTPASDAATVQESEGMQQLVHAVCRLQELRELSLCRLSAFVAAAGGPSSSSSFAALTALTSLSLSESEVSDSALTAILLQLPAGLQRLNCSGVMFGVKSGAGVTDAGLSVIGQLQQLTALSLGSTEVTDAGLAELAGLTRLKELDLLSTRVTDAGICAQLSGLPRLQDLYYFARSPQQRQRLAQQLPLCKVHWMRAE